MTAKPRRGKSVPQVRATAIVRGRTPVAVRLGTRFSQRTRPLAKQKLLDLAGRCFGQRAEHQRFRYLEACEARAAEGQDVGIVRLRRTRLQLEKRTRRLAPCWIRTRDDRSLHDCGMLREHLFDFEA